MRVGSALAFGALLSLRAVPAVAAEYIPPPIMPIPDAWQGRSQAVIRVLDKLDAHVETLTLKAGDTGTYKSLSVTVRSCMDRPDGLPADSGAFVEIQDRHGDVQPFSGWTFSGEPAIGVFESPVYGVQLVTCQGDLVAPAAPPLPQPVPAPPDLLPSPPPVAAAPDAGTQDDGATDASAGDGGKTSSGGPSSSHVDDGSESPPPANAPAQDGAAPTAAAPADVTAPGSPPGSAQAPAGGDAAAPDPVYPAGPPASAAPAPAAPAAPPQ